MPKVIQVIESEVSRGKGVPGDPCRMVRQYHGLDGELLAEHDPEVWVRENLADGLTIDHTSVFPWTKEEKIG